MNYIAHLHVASVTSTSLVGNFLGDFVKGRDLSALALPLQVGVQLHRNVDSFTDKHPVNLALKSLFPGELRKVAGIALDIYFDYLLVKDERLLNRLAQDRLFDAFYRNLTDYAGQHGDKYAAIRKGLLSRRWLSEYRQAETCLQAMHRVESRLRYKIVFAENAFDVLKKYHKRINQGFTDFYPELLHFSQQQAVNISESIFNQRR